MAQGYEARLLRVLDYVYANLDGDLSLDTLADVAAMSRFHFHRVFTGMTGETVAAFTRRVRLFRASIALVQTNDPVDQISTYCGYSNARSFAGAEILGDAEIAAPLEQMDIKGGAFAVLKYQGHYSGLAKAYAYLFGEWVPKSGKDLRDSPPFEVYLNTPQDTAAEDLITLICAPLK